MIWADKIGLLWGALVLTYIDILMKAPLIESPDFAMTLIVKLVLPVWAVLRMIDWIADGPGKRASARR